MIFCHDNKSDLGWKERHNTTEEESVLDSQSNHLFESFLCFETMFKLPSLFFWWHYGIVYSIPPQVWCLTGLPGRIVWNRLYAIEREVKSMTVIVRCQSLVCSDHQQGTLALRVLYFNSKSNLISAVAHPVILIDTVILVDKFLNFVWEQLIIMNIAFLIPLQFY